jgi:hypothetical protein
MKRQLKQLWSTIYQYTQNKQPPLKEQSGRWLATFYAALCFGLVKMCQPSMTL